jgi:hypothetical protein
MERPVHCALSGAPALALTGPPRRCASRTRLASLAMNG